LSRLRLSSLVRLSAAALALSGVLLFDQAAPSAQTTYTVYTSAGRRSLTVRSSGNVDLVSLDQVASLFGLTVTEDAVVGGLTVRGRGDTILLIPGQSFASIGPGRIVSLPGPLQRDRNGPWQVPIEFIQRAVGPALDLRVDLRKPAHLLLVGNVSLPRVSARIDRRGPNVRLVFDIEPATPHRMSRTANRLTLRFDAVALEWTPVTGSAPDFISNIRVDGTSVLIDLGPSAAGYRADDVDPTHLEITLVAPAPPPPPPPPQAPPATPTPAPAPAVPGDVPSPAPGPATPPRPAIDTAPGTLRTIVLDPGHGGDDPGAKGAKGTLEKDYVLQFARRLKETIESRIGLRVLLTRDGDQNVPVDRRAAIANNNKADLFISLHANASVRPSVSGVQIASLRLDDYRTQTDAAMSASEPVPVLGGGTRVIDVLPWDTAQIGFADASATIASILRQHLSDAKIPLYTQPVVQLPLRPLVGVSMPAILIELGFLTNAADEQAIVAGDRTPRVIDAVLATIADVRRGVPASPPPAAPAGAR
jgi:N-acetylmuramoyl-L-alanine amidase